MKIKEDKKMKKFMTNIKTLAALLMAGAAFTACSSSSDEIIEQPANPTTPKVYTMVIKATKGDNAATRALQTGTNGIDAYWDGTETFDVVQSYTKNRHRDRRCQRNWQYHHHRHTDRRAHW